MLKKIKFRSCDLTGATSVLLTRLYGNPQKEIYKNRIYLKTHRVKIFNTNFLNNMSKFFLFNYSNTIITYFMNQVEFYYNDVSFNVNRIKVLLNI